MQKRCAGTWTAWRRVLQATEKTKIGRTALVLALALFGLCAARLKVSSQSPEPSGILFTDIAPRSHFTYRTDNDPAARKYFVRTMCGGVAILDFDGDGKMDIFFTNGAKFPEMAKSSAAFDNCLLRNRGDGTFEDVTRAAGLLGKDTGYNLGVAAGDYDNDGRPDLFLCSAGRNVLYHNDGEGKFTDVTAASGITKPPGTLSVGAAWLDYDNDGLLDLLVSNYTTWSPQTDIHCGVGGADYYCDPQAYPDVPVRLYRNLGHGRFEDVTVKSGLERAPGKGMGIAVADFNNDGLQDFFIANDTEPNTLFLNKGDGTFEEVATPMGLAYDDNGKTVSAMGADAGDFDNDGRVDLIYNDLAGQSWQVFQNQSDSFRMLSAPSRVRQLSLPFSGWGMAFIDYDNDGWLDIYSANGDINDAIPANRQHDTLFRNLGGKTFEDVSNLLGSDFLRPGFQRGAAVVDLNNDGFEDLVVTSLNDRPRILVNSGGKGHHWLTLDLVGRSSNRDAIGSSVKLITGGGRTLYRHLSPSVGLISSSDKRIHFGLGAEPVVQSLEIRWPRGAVQKLSNVRCDTFMRVVEPLP